MPIKNAVIKQLQGITFIAKSDSNHWVTIDGPIQFGGSDAGPRAKELLLMALGGCTASDIISILKKKRVPVESFEIHLTGNVKEEHPQIYTDIHIEYVFSGDGLNPIDIERAIELSTTKYCAVSAMLRGNVNITHSYKLQPSEKAPAQLHAEQPA